MSQTYRDEALQFDTDGYVLVPDLLTAEEVQILVDAAHADSIMLNSAFELADTGGTRIRLAGWNYAGDDTFGLIARLPRIVDRMETFLGGEVYHYHSKMILKEPRVGGAWEWHQDYGYWYQNGCLFPDMASCLIAVDSASRANGCLEVLKGSHRMGRIEHGRYGGQTGADPEHVGVARERLEHVYCEMAPGAALFFHSNLLHASAQNVSEAPRWALICCYNAASNSPYKDSHHPRYNKLHKVDEDAVLRVGVRLSDASQTFIDPAEDKTSAGEKLRS
ncbi:phytanoyl-CoA dioxygenase family protein [Acidobacterium sp. S8]|uniref:phytanoyl-CoA dioxygenase family protein n=1 Tax=Acidobacterium sp. S8 TaxID=1641854 RepID=UPI00131C2D95|nr:phytanoyl-CoA dioxygenase family protein [Acidobacterium sp. S8]